MKPITKEDCELMWVWDGNYKNPKDRKGLVAIMYKNGCCRVLDGEEESTSHWDHCAPIEKAKVKKWVPCECREDLPEGFVNGWLRNKELDVVTRVGFYWISRSGEFFGQTFEKMFECFEWSPTFDGPYQPIGKMVEVEE